MATYFVTKTFPILSELRFSVPFLHDSLLFVSIIVWHLKNIFFILFSFSSLLFNLISSLPFIVVWAFVLLPSSCSCLFVPFCFLSSFFCVPSSSSSSSFFLLSYFLFLISYFLFLISYFLFLISHCLFLLLPLCLLLSSCFFLLASVF